MNNIIDNVFLGKMVKVNHPITCLNPDEFFKIEYVEIEGSIEEPKIYIRGNKTMWFNSKLIIDVQ